jgi:TatD DNase family protein
MSFTDAHCHLQDPAFAADLSAALARARALGVEAFVVNGLRPADWPAVADLARRENGVCPQFGLHPWHADEAGDWEPLLAECLLAFPKAGLGEIGLDAKLTPVPMDTQRAAFRRQLRLARILDRPCSIHCVGAWDPLQVELTAEPPPRFLLHAFGGSPEQVPAWVGRNAFFSFGGALLREPASPRLHDVLRAIPANRLLLETDAPYQHPQGKSHRQEPAAIIAIAARAAEIRGCSLEEIRRLSAAAAEEFFRL